jgi:hypothetical protein
VQRNNRLKTNGRSRLHTATAAIGVLMMASTSCYDYRPPFCGQHRCRHDMCPWGSTHTGGAHTVSKTATAPDLRR